MTVDTPYDDRPERRVDAPGCCTGCPAGRCGTPASPWCSGWSCWSRVTAGSTLVGNNYRNDNSLPGTDSQRVHRHLPRAPAAGGDGLGPDRPARTTAAWRSRQKQPDRRRCWPRSGRSRTSPSVADPFTAPGSLSPDGRTAYATVGLDVAVADMPVEDVRTIIDTGPGDRQAAASRWRSVATWLRSAAESAGGAAEGAGILAALVILVFLFGSLLAATLPLLTARVRGRQHARPAGAGLALFTVPDYTAPVMMLVGLGVGIDYALLIFSRYRSELLKGADRPRGRADDRPRHRRPIGAVRRLHRGHRAARSAGAGTRFPARRRARGDASPC